MPSVEEWEDSIREGYSRCACPEALARIKCDAQLAAKPVHLLAEDLPSQFVDGQPGGCSALIELSKILQAIRNGAECTRTGAGDVLGSIKTCVRKMRSGGYKPRVVSLSVDHVNEVWEVAPGAITKSREPRPITLIEEEIDVDGAPLRIPDYRTGDPVPLVFDPDCVEVTYATNDKARRLRIDVHGPAVFGQAVTTSIRMSVKILDPGGIVKIGPAFERGSDPGGAGARFGRAGSR